MEISAQAMSTYGNYSIGLEPSVIRAQALSTNGN